MLKTIYISTLFLFCGLFYNCIGQTKGTISSVKQNNQQIEITIKSKTKFYVGGNTHVLHVGQKDFMLNKQTTEIDNNSITFFVPIEEFNVLSAGDFVWMSYGNKLKESLDPSTDPADYFKAHKNVKNVWLLGKLNKTITK